MAETPNIFISFSGLASSIISRSERGTAILIVRDTTQSTSVYHYTSPDDVASTDYTAANLQYIKDIWALKSPHDVWVIRLQTNGTIADATALITTNIETGWVSIADGTTADFTDLVSWIGATEAAQKTYKAIVFGATSPDKKHVVNFANTNVVFADSRGSKTGAKYLPTLLGMIAGTNVSESITNCKCANLTSVTVPANIATAVSGGGLVLNNTSSGVRVVVGCNSLTTLASGVTSDMTYIDTVEAMDLIADDIRNTFKDSYSGKFRNTYDNQIILIAAINGYFEGLVREGILDSDYGNKADINVSAQRSAIVAGGKTEATSWSDDQVRHYPYHRTVYLTADIKILGSMDSLTFNIAMA